MFDHDLFKKNNKVRHIGRKGNLFLGLLLLLFCGMAPSMAHGACCEGIRGNADCDPAGTVDLGDLTALVDYLFISFSPLCCEEEANVDGLPGIDLGDLTALIDYLFISFRSPRLCELSGANPGGELVASGTCKSFGSSAAAVYPPPDMDCISYQYDESYRLSLRHLNAGFNCCPLILANVDIADGIITIEEIDSLPGCHCLCLFDLDYTFTELPPGKYRINVIEPLMPESDAPLDFEIDLTGPISGEICVARSSYPWGF